jgi:DNA-directed RNA polymerase subunit E"
MAEKACRNCKLIITQGDTCPLCGQKNLTPKWTGYVALLNAEKSEVAKKLGFKVNGSYALHIND